MGPKIYNVFMGIKENGASAVMVGKRVYKRGETFLLKPEWSDLRTRHPPEEKTCTDGSMTTDCICLVQEMNILV